MFTLIGMAQVQPGDLGILECLFPDFFPDQFKTETGLPYIVYFEAATVISTLDLLGQLLGSKGHSKTNSAVKELIKTCSEQAIVVKMGLKVEVSIDWD